MKLRAHHLLCLLGFRGYGYSAEHVEKLAQVQSSLPSRPLELLDSPDEICTCCPWLSGGSCCWGGEEQEGKIRDRDQKVLAKLSLVKGKSYLWGELRAKIKERLNREDLLQFCASCHWLSLGYCGEGLEGLQNV